jgi:flagellar M-ring protein FliF
VNFVAIFQRLRQMVVDLWQRTEKRDRSRFFVIAGASFIVIIVALVMLTRTTYVTLMSGSQVASLGTISRDEILTALADRNIAHRMDSDGAILVPEKNYSQALTQLASNPSTVTISLEIYKEGTGLTTNSAQQEQFRTYQLEAHIRQAICDIDGIENAFVMLAIPQGRVSILASQQPKPSASVYLRTRDGSTPNRRLVESVKAIAAFAVAGLEPVNVAVTYQGGALLDPVEDDYQEIFQQRFEQQDRMERHLEQGVNSLFEPIFGFDNFRLAANVLLNYDVDVSSSVEFTPSIDENGVVESIQTLREMAEGTFGGIGGIAGADENGMGDMYDEVDENGRNYWEKSTDTINYNVNEHRRTIEKAQGTIEKLTISATFNSDIFTGDPAFINGIKNSIAGAIGLTSTDNVQVLFEEFKGNKAILEDRAAWEAQQNRQAIMELIRIIALYVVIGVCIALLILKTYALMKKEPTEEELLADAIAEGYDPEFDEMAALVEMATLGEITEAPKSQFREQIENFIDKNPVAVADLLRNWLDDGG